MQFFILWPVKIWYYNAVEPRYLSSGIINVVLIGDLYI